MCYMDKIDIDVLCTRKREKFGHRKCAMSIIENVSVTAAQEARR